MQAFRSLIYTTLFFLVTAFFGVVVLISALLPLSIEQRYVIPRTWGLLLTWLAGVVCGLKYVVEGQQNLPKRPFISLWKHSSSWDTLAQMFVVPPAAWSLKREVIWIPIVGWAVRTYNPIAIDRSAGHSAVNQVIAQGRERLASGMGIVVYPEGTRVLPGETRKYGISGALLATKTGAPIVPIAHNSGYFWKRRAWMKYPGTIRVVIGPPIDPTGLDPREINARAQQWIEAKIAEIVIPKISLQMISDDPDDDRILECAVAGRADLIVSGDRHLRKLRSFENVGIVAPRDFLRTLG